ncbi:hypothetical protein SB00610_04987 [Klebsiella quasipneumoniae subsp. similipneumoniae]|nr:hypothetical protein SB00610_04987 [Klebsiella quasipneumoniae subsp. similipneumoniae]
MPLGDFEGQMSGEPGRQLIALPDARRRRKGIQLNAAHPQLFAVEYAPRLAQRRRNAIEQIKGVIRRVAHMGNIDKPAATGINKPVLLLAQSQQIFHRPERAVVVMVLAQRIQSQHVTNLVHRDGDAHRPHVQVVTKGAAWPQRFRRRQLAQGGNRMDRRHRGQYRVLRQRRQRQRE